MAATIQEVISLAFLLTSPVFALQPHSHHSNHTQEGLVRTVRSVSPWDYFPLLPLNIHDVEAELVAKVEREVHVPEWRPLCAVTRRRVELRELYDEDEYEYRPPHYFENICRGPNQRSSGPEFTNNLMCVYPGFSCVQRSQTVYLTRRKYDSSCWETFTRTIASSCECMWPVQSLGEVQHHYASK